MLEKTKAMRIFPLRIGVWKMRANVTKTRRAQKGVTDGVCQRVSIGMAHRTLFERHLNAAEHKLSARGESVQVITDAGPAHRPTSAAMRSRLK